MKTVIVRPERCVGCLQCRLACAVEHSAQKSAWRPSSRPPGHSPGCASIRGGGISAFPNKCRHCDPAPCQEVCIAGAIKRDASRGTVDIDPQRCISCAMCAMACPFGVLTYAPVAAAPDKLAVALKCDQCPDREKVGQAPACVMACKVGALTYGDWPAAQEDRAGPLPGPSSPRSPRRQTKPGPPRPGSASGGSWGEDRDFLRGGPGEGCQPTKPPLTPTLSPRRGEGGFCCYRFQTAPPPAKPSWPFWATPNQKFLVGAVPPPLRLDFHGKALRLHFSFSTCHCSGKISAGHTAPTPLYGGWGRGFGRGRQGPSVHPGPLSQEYPANRPSILSHSS